MALKHTSHDCNIIHSQLNSGYESGNGCMDTLYKIIGNTSSSKGYADSLLLLKASWINTLLGPMIAISDDHSLYLLEFADRTGLQTEIDRLRHIHKANIIPGQTEPISMIKEELNLYFTGKLRSFKTPLHFTGSDFQKKAWQALLQIPYGQTRSYKMQAAITGNEKAFRAVANANGANQLIIIIPCHRIINHNGNLGGYGGGKERKAWLLQHEKNNI